MPTGDPQDHPSPPALAGIDLATVLRQLPVPLVALDSSGRVTWVNDEAAALLEVRPGEAYDANKDSTFAAMPLLRGGTEAGHLLVVRRQKRRPRPALTPRQQEVLELLARGASTRRIADELGIAEDTARNHIRFLLSELGVHTRLEAVAIAFRNGWL